MLDVRVENSRTVRADNSVTTRVTNSIGMEVGVCE